MPDVIDLSTLGKDDQERLSAMAEENDVDPGPEPLPRVRTAFLVIVQEDGDVIASSDLGLQMERALVPNADDIYGACSVVMRDVSVQMTVQHTLASMQQVATQAQAQMQDAAIRSRLNLG